MIKKANAFIKVVIITIMIILAGSGAFSGCSSNTGESMDTVSRIAEESPQNVVPEEIPLKKTTESRKIEKLKPALPEKPDRNRLKTSITADSVTSSVYGSGKNIKVKRTAYLTFDDGPSRNNTPKNLNILKKYGIKATFFVLPQEGVDNIYRRILEEGHEIGNHSFSHDYSILYSPDESGFRLDLNAARDFIRDRFGYTSVLYRFPGGTMGRNRKLIESRAAILEEEGYDYVNWDISDGGTDTGENGKNVDMLVSNVLNGTGGRSSLVVLMHDSADKTATVEALPRIIEGLQRQGYTFELMTEK